MSRKPEIVVTGLHLPGVQFRARVLVRPERLQQVKERILLAGRVRLEPGEVLEIDTLAGDELRHAVTVADPGATRTYGLCLVEWNEVVGVITIYGDDSDHIAAIAEPVVTALVGSDLANSRGFEVCLDCDRIDSIKVGDVHVFFERDGAKDEAVADSEQDQDQDAAYLASVKRQTELRTALAAERLITMTLHRFTPGRRSA